MQIAKNPKIRAFDLSHPSNLSIYQIWMTCFSKIFERIRTETTFISNFEDFLSCIDNFL